jgi:hypothetical protein
LSFTGSAQVASAQGWPGRFRDTQIVNGLLAGACLIRTFDNVDQADATRTLTLADYELVRSLLQSSVVCSVDENFDALSTALIDRANVYLGVRYGDDSSALNPFYTMAEAPAWRSSETPAPQRFITRKEIADLGNTRSATVRRLIEYLQRANNYDVYHRLGFSGATPQRQNWQRRSVESLTAPLLTWSVKQVRTHFGQLQKAGLVAAERDRANGPWLYALPEEVTQISSPFRDLPPPADLEENLAAEE